ncbi:MAG: signal recognition particle protein [Caldisericaceae bacterium]
MFEGLKENLEKVFKKLYSKGRLSDEDIHLALRELRVALLEADVNIKIVRELIENIENKARESKVIDSITPQEQMLSIIYSELSNMLGTVEPLKLNKGALNYIVLCGLQGNGKTTTAGKLSYYLKNKGYKTLLVPFDFKRPAAREQLINIAKKNNIDYFDTNNSELNNAINDLASFLKQNSYEVAIIDTAGRTDIDAEVMEELRLIVSKLEPAETILVMDSTIGQTSLVVAEGFMKYVNLTGGIFTKFDSSAKGGSVLSFRYVAKAPIKFIGNGEHIQDLEIFDPNRIISRLLGKGDIQTLIEKAENAMSAKESEEILKKVQTGNFNFNDFKSQLQGIVKMGGLNQIMSMLPQTQGIKMPKDFSDEKFVKRMFAIIDSMTKEERENPDIINGSRKERIAKGSGVSKFEVNQLIKNFSNFKNMSKQFKAID